MSTYITADYTTTADKTMHEGADRCVAKFGAELLGSGDHPPTIWEVPAANAEAAKAELEGLGFGFEVYIGHYQEAQP